MSARVDFYLIVGERFRDQPLQLVAKLAQKAFASGQPTLVLARDREQAESVCLKSRIFLPMRNADQPPVTRKAPRVVGAGQDLGTTAVAVDET